MRDGSAVPPAAPVSGVLTKMTVKHEAFNGAATFKFRILNGPFSPPDPVNFTARDAGTLTVPSGNHPVDTLPFIPQDGMGDNKGVPIVAGEHLGVVPPNTIAIIDNSATGAEYYFTLGDHSSGTLGYSSGSPNREVFLQGTIEQDADGDGYGDESQDECPGEPAHAPPCAGTDMSITSTATPDPVGVGNDLTYVLEVKNNSASPGTSVNVQDNLPAGVNVVSVTPSQGSCTSGATVNCTLGSVLGGATATVTIVVRPQAAGTLVNTATVSASQPDGIPENNSTSTSTTATAGGGGGGPGGDTTAPVFLSARVTNAVFSVLGASASGGAPRGTTFIYSLSEAAQVVIRIHAKKPGRRVGGRCRRPTRTNRTRPRCTRFVLFGRLTDDADAGQNRRRFSGRIGKKKMRPGRYRARLVATDASGNKSKRRDLNLRVVRR
jgi:uncharacterized repeat protein (TIGR01451 family)